MENTETQVWLEFAYSCQYLTDEEYKILIEKSKEIGKLLDYYMHNPAKFRRNSDK
jgi:four helix bundle protein